MAKQTADQAEIEKAPVQPESRTYVAESDFVASLANSITGTGETDAHRVVDLTALVDQLRADYPGVKVNSIRQRIYKVNKALDGRRKFVIAPGPDNRKRDIEAYMAL
jgi:SpoVK/Ycf46/Vps4 family AAA+-type ATPase